MNRSATLFLTLATLVLLAAAALRIVQLHAYPPGPHYDEAVNLILSRNIAFGGARFFPIVNAYQGREVLYYYLNAPVLHLLGDRMFTLQLVSVFSNLLTVAAGMALGRAMFGGRRGVVVGLAVGVAMAISFPLLLLSRQGFRAITLPLCQTLALALLWRGLTVRRGNWRWLMMGGVFAGAAVYTYMASRLFPVWLALGGLALLVADRQQRWRRLRQGVLFFGVMAAVIAPMGWFALNNPDIFLGRLTEVTQVEDAVTLTESVQRHARMFFLKGEDLLRYNDPGRPYFTLVEGVLLLIGLGVAGWRLFGQATATEKAAYALALLSPLMVLPSVISVGGLPPNHMRSVGMVPLIFVLLGVGFEAVFSLGVRSRWRGGLALAVTVGLVIGGGNVWRDYTHWASRADLFYQTDTDLALAAAWLRGQVDEDTRVYIAAQDRGHPTVMIANLPFEVVWLGTQSLFRPPPDMTGLYIFPRSAPPPDTWRMWLEPGMVESLPLGPDGRTAFEAFRVNGDAALPIQENSDATITNGVVSLLGVDAPPTHPSDTAEVVSYWQVEQPPNAADLTPIVLLEDEQGVVLARGEAFMTDTDAWLPGEVLMQRTPLDVPLGTPPGDYTLRMTWVERSADRYLPFVNTGVWSDVGSLPITRPTVFPDSSRMAMDVRVDEVVAAGVRLLGWNPPPEQVRPGESLPLTMFWQGTPVGDGSALRENIAVRAVLVNQDGAETTLYTGQPVRGRHPSSAWIDGELIADPVRWQLPRDLDAGNYTLTFGVGDEQFNLGNVSVEGLPRVFDEPEVEVVVDSLFADTVRLHGYSVTFADEQIQLELVWQAISQISHNYTVFVHMVDNAGNILAQRDVMPQNNTYPTTLWLDGEYVLDQHVFEPRPADAIAIRIGLYQQATGSRLTLTTAEGEQRDFVEVTLFP